MNFASWARSRSEVYAARRGDLDRALVSLGPLNPRADQSAQLHVRASVLPDFNVDADGEIKVIQRHEPGGDDVQKRSRYDSRARITAARGRRDPSRCRRPL